MTDKPSILAPRQPLGAHWDAYFGMSAFGALWRAMRLNRLACGELRSFLGVSITRDAALFRRLMTSRPLHNALQRMYSSDSFSQSHMFTVFQWWPFGGSMPSGSLRWRARCCIRCARSCYHSVLFQMPRVTHCPWHHIPLIDECPRCGRDLLAGFPNGLPLGICPCGRDGVDYLATIEGDSNSAVAKRTYIEEYLRETQLSRRRTWLLAPEAEDEHGWRALEALSEDNRARRPPGVIVDDITFDKIGPEHETDLKRVLESSPTGFLALPSQWSKTFRSIARQRAHGAFELAVDRIARESDLQCDSDFEFDRQDHCTYLQTGILHRTVLRTSSRLSGAIGMRSSEFRDDWLQHRRIGISAHGVRLVEKTIFRLLARGFSDGAREIGARQARADVLEESARYPWVLLRLHEGRLPSARIAWTDRTSTQSRH